MRPWSEMDIPERVLSRAETHSLEARHVIHAVVRLHHAVREVNSDDRRCSECDQAYPCATVRAMAEAMEVSL